MRKSLTLLCILSLLILFSCNNGTPDAPVEKEFKGKTFTIELSPEGSRTIGEKGILSLIISEDEKSLEWVLTEPKELSGFNIYSGIFEDISIVKSGNTLKITSGEKLSIELQSSETGYSVKSEGKLNEIVINTTAKVTLSTISDTSKIDSFIGHSFWYKGSSTAGLLEISSEKVSLKYYSNYKEDNESWTGDGKMDWDCSDFKIEGSNLVCVIPKKQQFEGKYIFKILNTNQLQSDIEADKQMIFNIVK